MSLYDNSFFDWVDHGASTSAQEILRHLISHIEVDSVIDVGCGRGAWLAEWRRLGVMDIAGIDGSHVEMARLAIPTSNFMVADLGKKWRGPSRRFALSQSLEVGEHLPSQAAGYLVDGLCGLSDVVLFSAATPGQGGEWHVNEQEPAYWAGLFWNNGYSMFDCVRVSSIVDNSKIQPWYRFNMFVYANDAGEARLSAYAKSTRVALGGEPREVATLSWQLRRLILKPLPVGAVTKLSRGKYKASNWLRRHVR